MLSFPPLGSQSNMVILKSVAMNVPGKNSAAMNVKVVIEILSCLFDLAIRWLSLLAHLFNMLSC